MHTADKVQMVLDVLGLDYDQLEEVQYELGEDGLHFKFCKHTPAIGYVCEQLSRTLGQKFMGVRWSQVNNEFVVFYESEPESSSS